MRVLDKPDPIDPEIVEALDAIDATLAGEPVDARHADLAEVALLLSSDRPTASSEFAGSMDERVARRFGHPAGTAPKPRRASSTAWPVLGAVTATVALVVVIVVAASNYHGASSGPSSSATPPAGANARPSAGPASGAASTHSSAGPASGAARTHSSAGPASGAKPAPNVPAPAQALSSSAAPGVQPPSTGRKVVQSAQLELTAAPNRIDDVAQEVYDVVAGANGIVNSSTVTQTGGLDGYAEFQLSLPSSSLPETMSRLSQLTYAQVASRTDNTQDITDQYTATTRALADARALRTSLLKQLANAVTTEQVDSLTAQIHDAEASISSDEATLARLNNQVDYSQVWVTINARNIPAPIAHGSGFTLGGAAHDAGRVLTVMAAVALIAAAALSPVALLAALAWWIGASVRRHRREHALDLV